jgi:hypothetical protein
MLLVYRGSWRLWFPCSNFSSNWQIILNFYHKIKIVIDLNILNLAT